MADSKAPAGAVDAEDAETEEDRKYQAKYALHPVLHSARAIHQIVFRDESMRRLDDLCDELAGQVKAVKQGDMARPEAILTAQAHTLDGLFGHLIEQAVSPRNFGHECDLYFRNAFKAQNQCRATIEALMNLTNPRAIAIMQTNIGENVQVNNGLVGLSGNAPNKLLDTAHEQRLVNGTAQATVGADSAVATVGAFNGTPDADL